MFNSKVNIFHIFVTDGYATDKFYESITMWLTLLNRLFAIFIHTLIDNKNMEIPLFIKMYITNTVPRVS
jgi:hypothetical protein